MQSKYFPYFQPIIDVRRRAVVGYEALARSRDVQGQVGSLGPLFSDPLYDREALLLIDRSVRLKAVQRFATVQHEEFLSLNMSPEWQSEARRGRPLPLAQMADECGVAAQQIMMEFSEAAGDNPRMQALLGRYRAAGMRIAIDNFGSGRYPPDRLLALQPEVVKMDMRAYKSGIVSEMSRDFARELGGLAQRSGSLLCCVGIESRKDFFFALDCGARYVQGYLFYPPLAELLEPNSPRRQLEALMQEYTVDGDDIYLR